MNGAPGRRRFPVQEPPGSRRLHRSDLARHQPVADDRRARVPCAQGNGTGPSLPRWLRDRARVPGSRRFPIGARSCPRPSRSSSGCRATPCCPRCAEARSARASSSRCTSSARHSRRCFCRAKSGRRAPQSAWSRSTRRRAESAFSSPTSWDAWRRRAGKEAELDGLVGFSAPLEGSLAFLHREPSKYPERRCRAIRAWIWNRGTRDTWQAIERRSRTSAQDQEPPLRPARTGVCAGCPFFRNSCRRSRAIDQCSRSRRTRRGPPLRIRAPIGPRPGPQTAVRTGDRRAVDRGGRSGSPIRVARIRGGR